MKVVAAILVFEEKVLAFQRPFSEIKSHISLKYEFPGGKIKKNETETFALKRELREELSIEVCNLKKYFSTSYKYTEETIHINFYISKINKLNFKLNAHVDYKLVRLKDLKTLDWLEADYSVINCLQQKGFSSYLF